MTFPAPPSNQPSGSRAGLAPPPMSIDYRVAIICALPLEADAVRAVFSTFWADDRDSDGIIRAHNDPNHYTTGTIHGHNVVIAHMPKYGKGSSATVAANIRHTFPDIALALVVGICGGVPSTQGNEIMLGDVVISECVVEYDRGRQFPNWVKPINTLGDSQNADLQGFLTMLRGDYLQSFTAKYLEESPNAEDHLEPTPKPTHLGFNEDKLYESTHRHKHHIQGQCETCDACVDDTMETCDESKTSSCEALGCSNPKVRKRSNNPKDTKPRVHRGKVGSADLVMKSGRHRDQWADHLGIIAFEMEGAGVCGKLPCLVIKGVCDYADSHKSKDWQDYAAATAAACMKAVLKRWRPSVGLKTQILTLTYMFVSLVDLTPEPVQNDESHLEMMRNLFVIDPTATRNEIERNRGLLLPGTGSWIFSENNGNLDSHPCATVNSVFNRWWNNEKPYVLWLRGDPGKGKTMLAISLIDNIQQRLDAQEPSKRVRSSLAYFFCAYDDEDKREVSCIIRSFLWQLLTKHPSLVAPFRRIYDTQERTYLLSKSSASLFTLLNSLELITDELGFSSYFVIDALDECSPESRDTFLRYLEGAQIMRDTQRQGKIKWLITTRNNVEVGSSGSVISLEENASHVDTTISQYLSCEVEKLALVKKYSEDVQKEVRNSLSEKANGTFLWAALVCQELKTVGTIGISTLVNELPRGLPRLYQRMLRQILDNQNSPNLVPFALDILRTVVIATRPLGMKELAIAADLPEDIRDEEHQIRECALLCGSFLNPYDASGCLSLVHPSVRDYLVPRFCPKPGDCLMGFTKMFCSEPDRCHCSKKCLVPDMYPEALEYRIFGSLEFDYRLPIEDIRLHRVMAERCVKYLTSKVFKQRPRRTQPRREVSAMAHEHYWKYPLAKYALCFWVIHARQASYHVTNVIKTMKSLDQFLTRWLDVISELKRCEDTPPFDGQLPHSEEPTLLCIGAYTGIPDIVKLILDNGVDVNQKDYSDLPALYYASDGGHEAVTQLLIQKGADVNAKSKDGATALLAAVKSGHEAVAGLLLDANADHHIQQGSLGGTPLHVAADRMALQMAAALIEHGADVSSRDYSERTPLHIAAAGGTHIMQRLLRIPKPRGGCSASAGSGSVTTMISTGPLQAKEQRQNRSYTGMIELLLYNDADISARDINGHTPLHFAVGGGYESIAEELISFDAEIDAMDKDGWTPLQWTVETGLVAISCLLLENGADPNKTDKFGRTALHWATKKGHTTMVKLLLEFSAEPNVLDTWSGATPLHLAVYDKKRDIALLLLKSGADLNVQPEAKDPKAGDRKAEWERVPFPKTFDLGHRELLLEKFMDKEHSTSLAGMPLYWANEEMATMLLDHGADPNLQDSDFGDTALHSAVFRRKQNLVKVLLERRASPNVPDKLGKAPLHYTDRVEIAEILLDAGAEIDAMDMTGITALHTAAAYGERHMVQLLLMRGADPLLMDNTGKDVLGSSMV
ncbi:hypothetical protein FAUST_10467 [Fusarium austroamericanum]|uniref:Nucleoside phosphorylase domain-containing protein n=1 Tax=Fusarium austroamericanum TaxID=282268 RepID=A0AAN5Z0R1_FUSAU|nr:hypothetical protein FAUST_10467 [Fusarium austroamericanum]